MILFFNMTALTKESKSNPILLISILKDFYNVSKPLKYGLRSKLKGHSFLLHPEELFNDSNTDILYIYQYILLASKRDYALYKLYGITSLQLSYYPDINLDSIRTNPLLKITQTEIQFKYEEVQWH